LGEGIEIKIGGGVGRGVCVVKALIKNNKKNN